MGTTAFLLLSATFAVAQDTTTKVECHLRGLTLSISIKETPKSVVAARVLGPAAGKAIPSKRIVDITTSRGDHFRLVYEEKDLRIQGVPMKGIVFEETLTDDRGTEYTLIKGEPFC